ncbi:MAG: ABC transporter ATP-binding protein, partial [Ruminococcus sp.]|nr:ABC transporter ATP-binding protein [Ruminococcus sp.]
MPPPNGRLGPGYLTDEEKKNKPKVTKKLIKRIFSYLLPYKLQMLFVLAAILCSAVLTLLPSVLTGRIIDEGLIAQNMRALVLYILLSFGVTLLANLIGILESYLNTWIAQHITFDMRNSMYAHLQKMSMRFFTSNNQGDIITRMTSDISGVQQIITSTLTSIISNTITLTVALILMFSENWKLALVGIAVVPLFVIPTRSAGKRRWSITKDSQACSDEINGILNETLSVSGQLLVKQFGMEKKEYDHYESVNRKMIGLNIKESMAGRWFRMALGTFTNIGPMLIYLVGGIIMMRFDKTITVGQISVLVALLGKMYMPVNQLLNIQVDWIRSMAMFTRIFEYYDMKPEIENAPDAVRPSSAEGEVEFRNVRFYYEPEREKLHDISFRLSKGKCIAIVGPSGSGKS